MVALRSRRLDSVFGASLDALEAHHIRGLVTAGVQEAFDLDFKQALYGRGDSDRRALAGDVAALANTGGGVIVLGVEEDDQARAKGTPGVEVSDSEVGRMRQIVASLIAPMPTFDIYAVPDESTKDSGTAVTQGFIIVAVPRSPAAPHAVLVNEALRFPARNGATTRYLSEPEVATSYRNRFANSQQQSERVVQIEEEAIGNLAVGGHPWIVVSLVPDLPGAMNVNRETFEAFDQDVRQRPLTLTNRGLQIMRTRVARRRLLADGTSNQDTESRWLSLALHQDGAGVFAMAIADLNEHRARQVDSTAESEKNLQLLSDEWIAEGILTGLLQLASNARDRAAAGGTALIRAQVYPVSPERPTTIGHTRMHGFPDSRTGNQYRMHVEPAEAAAALDDLAQPGPRLVEAGALLLDELGQSFGVPEMGQLSRDGRIRRLYWGAAGGQAPVVSWARQNGIEVIDERI